MHDAVIQAAVMKRRGRDEKTISANESSKKWIRWRMVPHNTTTTPKVSWHQKLVIDSLLPQHLMMIRSSCRFILWNTIIIIFFFSMIFMWRGGLHSVRRWEIAAHASRNSIRSPPAFLSIHFGSRFDTTSVIRETFLFIHTTILILTIYTNTHVIYS